MRLDEVILGILNPALALLPMKLDSLEARVMLLAIGQQESRFQFRRQLGDGPARGFWQFERGTPASRGGVWGVFLHPASAKLLADLCAARSCPFDPMSIWIRLETDDLLACGVARLMLLTDAAALPSVDDAQAGWDCYARTWRPGRPHRSTWDNFHSRSREAVEC